MSNGDTTAPARPGRAPISVKWHHSTFEVALVSVQALTAAVTMVLAIVGALYVQDEQEDRRQARMTRAWNLLYETRGEIFHNVGQVEALQSLYESGANLREINMSSRYLQGVALPGAGLHRAIFKNSKLMEADLRRADLRQTTFVRANLTAAALDGADLRGAALASAELAAVRFGRADLEGASLANADLSGADLRRVRNLTAAQVAEACTDPDDPPILPQGFAPPPDC